MTPSPEGWPLITNKSDNNTNESPLANLLSCKTDARTENYNKYSTASTLTHWPQGNLNEILDKWSSSFFLWLMSEVSLIKLSSDECHWTLLTLSQHWFRWWLGAVRKQAITWASVDTDLCRHMTSVGHNELTLYKQHQIILQINGLMQQWISELLLSLATFLGQWLNAKDSTENYRKYSTASTLTVYKQHQIDGLVQDRSNSIADILDCIHSQ